MKVLNKFSSFLYFTNFLKFNVNSYTNCVNFGSRRSFSWKDQPPSYFQPFACGSSHHSSFDLSPSSSASFEFVSAGRIVFGRNSSNKLPEIINQLGATKILMVLGRTGRLRYAQLLKILVDGGLDLHFFTIEKEPGTIDISAGVSFARNAGVQAVVGLGGGSVIDGAKAIAALATNPGPPLDYMEGVGKGLPIKVQPLPFIAIPTTAGTGSEVTKNSVITAEEQSRKVSIRSPMMLPLVAILDPVLAVGTPPHITACTGLDCLTQCIEPYVSCNANPFTDGLSREGIVRAARSIRTAYLDGSNLDAREDLTIAATLGGLALANAKLGAVHGFAGCIGGMYPTASHGAVCAALLPHAFRMNAKVLAEKAKNDSKYQKFLLRHQEVARLITENDAATAEDGADWLEDLVRQLNIPSLASFGVKREELHEIAKQSAGTSSMQGNPVQLSTPYLEQILHAALT